MRRRPASCRCRTLRSRSISSSSSGSAPVEWSINRHPAALATSWMELTMVVYTGFATSGIAKAI